MSKSKSRQPSRQVSVTSKNGSNGTANKTTAKAIAAEAPESTEKDANTSTPIEIASDKTTSKVAVDDAPETTEVDAPSGKTTKILTATRGTDKVTEDVVPASTAKAANKTAKTVPAASKPAPAKAIAKPVPNAPLFRPVPNTPAGAGGKSQSRDAAKYERRQQERQMRYLAERRARRNRFIIVVSVLLAVAIIAAGTYYVIHMNATTSVQAKAAQGSYQEAIYNTNYPPVESVYCDQLEQSIEHIHAYVAIYIDGKASPLPANVGIPQDSSGNATCFYWLHTHDTSGVIHIESPSSEVFTFGQFRDVWDQQFVSLGFPPELLLTTGWKIWINGHVYNGSLANIPLAAHNIITLAYNSPDVKPVTTYAWNGL